MKRRPKDKIEKEKVLHAVDLHAWMEMKRLPSAYETCPPDKEKGLFDWSNAMARNLWLQAKTVYGVEIGNAHAIADLIYKGVITGKGKK